MMMLRCRTSALDLTDRIQPVQKRHADVRYHDIGIQLRRGRHQRSTVVDGSQESEFLLQKGSQAFSYNCMIVGQHYCDHG